MVDVGVPPQDQGLMVDVGVPEHLDEDVDEDHESTEYSL